MTETAAKPKLKDLSKYAKNVGTPRKLGDTMTALFYALKGVGKTTVAASADWVPSMSPCVLMAFEEGSSSIGEAHPDMPVIRPEDWDDALDFFEAALNEDLGIQTIIIDTVAEAHNYILEWSVATFGDTDGFKKWANVYDEFAKVLKALHKKGINVICLAHADRVKDNVAQSIYTAPYFLGNKSDTELPKIFDIIGYMFMEEDGTRVMQLEPSSRIVAGNRSEGRLPAEIENPTMEKIVKALNENPARVIQ